MAKLIKLLVRRVYNDDSVEHLTPLIVTSEQLNALLIVSNEPPCTPIFKINDLVYQVSEFYEHDVAESDLRPVSHIVFKAINSHLN